MKISHPAKPYIIEVLFRGVLTPTDGVTQHAWEAFVAAIEKMERMRTYNGVQVTYTNGGPAHTAYILVESEIQACLERFMDRAYTIARSKHVRLLR